MADIDVQTNTILNTAQVTENGSTKTLQQALSDLRAAAGQGGGGGGSGDMTKAVYDPNNDGIIGLAAGGTNASTASGARTALGVAIGTDVAAYNHTHTLDALSDVTAPSPTNGQALTWNGSAWVNTTLAGGGNMTTSTYDAATVAEQLVGLTATQTVENKRLKDTAQIVNPLGSVGGGTTVIDLNAGNVITATLINNQTFNITTGIQSAGNAQVAEFWLTGNYTPTFQVNGNAVTFVNGSPGAQSGGATYLYAVKLNGSSNAVGFNAAGSGAVGNLDSLTDVVITTPSNTQVLTYNGTNWVNAAAPSGTGGITWFQVTPSGGAATVNMTNGNGAYATMTQDTTFSITNWPAGEDRLVIELTGNYTPTFSGVTFPGGNPGAQSVSPTTYVIYSRNDGSTKVGSIAVGPAGSGSGDVTAASAFGTDNRLVRSDGTGKGVQASGITIDDSNNVSGVGTLNGATLPSSGTIATVGQSYATVQEEGSALTQRATLNFIGAGVTAADNAGQTRTDVTIKGTKAYVEDTDVQNGETFTTTSDAFNEITLTGTTASRTITVAVPSANSTVEQTILKCINSGATTKTRSFGVSSGTLQWCGGSAPAEMTTDQAWQLISFVSRKNSSGTAVTIGTLIGASS